MRKRVRLEIHGAVQGVGFRPFVYRLATEMGLHGWVLNDTRGVFIDVEGTQPLLQHFIERVRAEQPPLAHIHSLDIAWLSPHGYETFEIRHSDEQGSKLALVLPDIATCDDCLREIFDPGNRRYHYAFTNCTNCGPRFSIIQALPYDRPNTTMSEFAMCEACQREYDSPHDRRFHAQPNACPVCGPQLSLATPTSQPSHPSLSGVGQSVLPSVAADTLTPPPSPIQGESARCRVSGDAGGVPGIFGEAEHARHPTQKGVGGEGKCAIPHSDVLAAAEAIRNGQIVAVKGLGGFHLLVDGRSTAAIARLRQRKQRGDKPFALMVRDLEQAHILCHIPPQARALLAAPEAPVVLLHRRDNASASEQVAPGLSTLGVMLPSTPLHHMLLRETGFPLVATSGNLSDEPICTDNAEALQRLGHIADLFLLHNRPIQRHVDDSVAWVIHDEPRLLRRARGYAPLPVLLRRTLPTILAVGAHLKNTIALSVGTQAATTAGQTPVFISQHIGDLETPEALEAFDRVIADFLSMYETTPAAIAHDMHPDYLSTQWAKHAHTHNIQDCTLIPVQHHHAHLAACLADHDGDIQTPALGIVWDGTGYGPDATVWGGEWLLGNAARATRVAHLRYFRLPGSEAAVREPRRVALALLWELVGEAALHRDDLEPVRSFAPNERQLLAHMLRHNLNAPSTSSAGRLFDGIAALIGLRQHVSFEGQAAILLEHIADTTTRTAYPLDIRHLPRPDAPDASTTHGPLIEVDWRPLVAAILDDLQQGTLQAIMAAKFHNALVESMLRVAQSIGEPRIALSGGCFQNRLLTERAIQRLGNAGFKLLLHRQVPPNDGGISLGQVVVAAAKLQQL